jgi:hypothetical protein
MIIELFFVWLSVNNGTKIFENRKRNSGERNGASAWFSVMHRLCVGKHPLPDRADQAKLFLPTNQMFSLLTNADKKPEALCLQQREENFSA